MSQIQLLKTPTGNLPSVPAGAIGISVGSDNLLYTKTSQGSDRPVAYGEEEVVSATFDSVGRHTQIIYVSGRAKSFSYPDMTTIVVEESMTGEPTKTWTYTLNVIGKLIGSERSVTA
ncbi:hypothetical protein SH501x_001409 [Pirellulaceae bacterium SH501]